MSITIGLPSGYSPFPKSPVDPAVATRFARIWRECEAEIRLAREQCTKHNHLAKRVGRVAVRAMRTLLDAINAGVFVKVGSFDDHDDVMSDIGLGSCWTMHAVPWVRAIRPDAFSARAGSRDFGTPIIDPNGKACVYGPPLLAKNGRVVYVEHDHDDADKLDRQQFIALDWAAACGALAELAGERLAKDDDIGAKVAGDASIHAMTISEIADDMRLGEARIREGADGADVHRPKSGGHGTKIKPNDIKKIARWLHTHGKSPGTRAAAGRWLQDHGLLKMTPASSRLEP